MAALEQLNIKIDSESEAAFRAYCTSNNLTHKEGFKNLIASGMGMIGANGPHPAIAPAIQAVTYASVHQRQPERNGENTHPRRTRQ
jgi:hypothetical protein